MAAHPYSGKTVRFFIPLLALGLLLAGFIACGGDDQAAGETPTAPPATGEATPAGAPPPGEETVTVNQEVWRGAFKITVEDASLVTDESGRTDLEISILLENLSSREARFGSTFAVTSGGVDYVGDEADSELPAVPALRTGRGTLVIEVDEAFSLDDATLVLGNPTHHQAVVPLGPRGDGLVTLEPVETPAGGSGAAGNVNFEVEKVIVLANLPYKNDVLEARSMAMEVYFSVTPQPGIPLGQGVLQSPNVALELPDGTRRAVIPDGQSGVNELLQGREGTTIPDLAVRFEVPAPVGGEYKFIVEGNYTSLDVLAEGEVAFTVDLGG
jgi:hypothetical protein